MIGSQSVTYGERFRQLRLRQGSGDEARVLDLALKLGKGYPSSVYNIEQRWRPPNLRTIEAHARALGCQPWELLEDVETEYDLARALSRLPARQALERWRDLVARTNERRPKKARAPGGEVRIVSGRRASSR